MADRPYFSIITPTYNREKFLAEMIKSVQAQSFTVYEHIIVDDGSSDGTEELVKSLAQNDTRIVYIKQENKGRSVARNVGIEAAKGQFICFLDSDDVWLPDHLQVIGARTKTATSPQLYHTGLIWFYEDGTPDHKVEYTKRDQFTSDTEYVIANQFAPDCVCIQKEILEKHRFRPELFINEDIELWARIAAEYPVVSIGKHTAKLRVHGGNTDKEFKDNVTPRIEAFNFILQNPMVRKQLSNGFVRNRKRGLHELRVRYLESSGQRWALITALIGFLFRYPTNPRNAAKLVTLLYKLPGGSVLKSLSGSRKSPSR